MVYNKNNIFIFLDIIYSFLIGYSLKIKLKRNYLLIIRLEIKLFVSILYYILYIFIALDIYMRNSIKVKINEKKYFFGIIILCYSLKLKNIIKFKYKYII